MFHLRVVLHLLDLFSTTHCQVPLSTAYYLGYFSFIRVLTFKESLSPWPQLASLNQFLIEIKIHLLSPFDKTFNAVIFNIIREGEYTPIEVYQVITSSILLHLYNSKLVVILASSWPSLNKACYYFTDLNLI